MGGRSLPISLRTLCLVLGGMALFPCLGHCQASVGLSLQGYPTGVITTLNGRVALGGKQFLELRAGYNAFDHRDQGIQDDEHGGGWGGSLAYLRPVWRELNLGIRTDLWWNRNHWTDMPGTAQEVKGTTRIMVIQPTLQAEWRIELGRLSLIPSLAFGVEINAVTQGEEVGQGLILLAGIAAFLTVR